MTVADLIEELKKRDQSLPAFRGDFEDGETNITQVLEEDIYDPNKPLSSGALIKAVVIR